MAINFKIYRQYGALNSQPVFDAFEVGLKHLGHNITAGNEDVAVIWSVLWNGRMVGNRQVYHQCLQTNKPVIVLEVGGIQRGTTWKVGLNGVNRGAFSLEQTDPCRAEKLGLMLKPWRTAGDHILICGQHERSLQWENMSRMSQWVADTIRDIRKYSDRKIFVRPHPRCPIVMPAAAYKDIERQQPIKITGTYDDFDLKFKGVHAVVSWSSNPGIRSVINGVPAVVGPLSLAYDVAEHDLSNIENLCMPDRQSWLNEYAHTEWTVEEIRQGIPLSRLLPKITQQLS